MHIKSFSSIFHFPAVLRVREQARFINKRICEAKQDKRPHKVAGHKFCKCTNLVLSSFLWKGKTSKVPISVYLTCGLPVSIKTKPKTPTDPFRVFLWVITLFSSAGGTDKMYGLNNHIVYIIFGVYCTVSITMRKRELQRSDVIVPCRASVIIERLYNMQSALLFFYISRLWTHFEVT